MLEMKISNILGPYKRCAVPVLFALFATSCSSGGSDTKGGRAGDEPQTRNFTIQTDVSGNGSISPSSAVLASGKSQIFTLTPGRDNQINSVEGCAGTLMGNTYTVTYIKSNCTISVKFLPSGLYTIDFLSDGNGRFEPDMKQLLVNSGFEVELVPEDGYIVDGVTGCGGELTGNRYVVRSVSGNCAVHASFKKGSYLTVTGDSIKGLLFSWGETPGATHYRIFERAGEAEDFSQIADDILAGVGELHHKIAVHLMKDAQYQLHVCTDERCSISNTVQVTNQVLVDSIGYFKASNTGGLDRFGQVLKMSRDGSTFAVAAVGESSAAQGVDGDQFDDSADGAGAVYVFSNKNGNWAQQAYIKASNAEAGDYFGSAIDLSADGSILVVGAYAEASSATQINGDEDDNSAPQAGAVYVFTRDELTWKQQAYIKPQKSPRPGYILEFGRSLALDADGDTLAVGSLYSEVDQEGPVHIFRRSGNEWTFEQFVRPALGEDYDNVGASLALSADGLTLAFGAPYERSAATGVNGDEADNSLSAAGAAYIFNYLDGSWVQKAYIKSSNPEENDFFGNRITLSDDGKMFAVGVDMEDSPAVDMPDSGTLPRSGSVYIYQLIDNDWDFMQMIKASNAAEDDRFGTALSFNANGSLLAVGANFEGSTGVGVEAGPREFLSKKSGAVYLFGRNENIFEEISLIKAKNAYGDAMFGGALSLNADGETLAVGAAQEDGGSTGIGGDDLPFGSNNSGAVYLY